MNTNLKPYPRKTMVACLMVTIVAFLSLGAVSFVASWDLEKAWGRDFEIAALMERIVYLDEVLTMSARMAALTGKLEWEARYRRHEPELDQAIKRITLLVPTAFEIDAAEKTDAANVKLVEMENRAFQLVQLGQIKEATGILLGDEYVVQKKIYADGMVVIGALIGAKAEKAKRDAEHRTLFAVAVALVLTPVMLYGWFLMLRTLRRWQEEIVYLNQTLEKRVAERTSALLSTSKMAALGEMAGGIAHEINNPLAVISGRSNQIQRLLRSDPVRVDRALEFVTVIATTTDRIAAIVQSLRSFSRSGEKDVVADVSMKDVLADTLKLCSERMRHRGVDLRIEEIQGDLTAVARPVQVSQILLNLLNNAHDAVETLDRKWIEVDVVDRGDIIQVSVTDSGAGIPEAIRDQIMLPFFTTKDIGKGTGLGLSVSKSLAEDNGGSLTLDTASPNTRFVLTLPKAKGGGGLRPAA